MDNETFSKITAGTPVTSINKVDILQSGVYEDNLGGFYEEVMIDPGSPAIPGIAGWAAVPDSKWGTTVVSPPKVAVQSEWKGVLVSRTIPAMAFTGPPMPEIDLTRTNNELRYVFRR